MKKVTTSLLFLLYMAICFGQQTTQKHGFAKTDYLFKSKKQKTIGWILIATGAAMFTVSALVPEGDPTGEISYPCLCRDVHQNDDIKGALGLTGIVSALASIPFFIASGKNQRKAKAASLFINAESRQALAGSTIRKIYFPAIGMRVTL